MVVQQVPSLATLSHFGNFTTCLSHYMGLWLLDCYASEHIVGNLFYFQRVTT